MGRLFTCILVSGLIVATSAQAGSPQEGDWLPDRNSVSQIESSATLPPDAKPLQMYARYYTGVVAVGGRVPGNVPLGHRLIWAEYVLPENWGHYQAGIHIVARDSVPLIMDGGCSIIHLYYDVDVGRVAWVRCNSVR